MESLAAPKEGPGTALAFSGLYSQAILSAVRHTGGERLVRDLLDQVGETRSEAELGLDSTWSTYPQLRVLAEGASRLLGGPSMLGPGDGPIGVRGTTDAVLEDPGSLNTMFEALARSNRTPTNRVESSVYTRLGDTTWRFTATFDPGVERFAEFCHLTRRLISWLPRSRGINDFTVVEVACRCAGAPACVFELHWEERDELIHRLAAIGHRVQALEKRLAGLQEAVRDIVSDCDLETALDRVVRSASAAVGIPGFVLALDHTELVARPVFYCGVEPQAAAAAADRLRQQGTTDWALVAEIATPSRRYGWLAGVDHVLGPFIEHERTLLESYARLAAAALDVAFSLEMSRREAATARSLLNLARALAVVTTTDEMADRLAGAVSEVIDCDRAAVALRDPSTGYFRIAATVGYGDDLDRQLRQMDFPDLYEQHGPQIQDTLRDELANPLHDVMVHSGSAGQINVPIIVEEQILGSVVATVTDHPERLRNHPELQERLEGLAAQAAIALGNARLLDQVRDMALRDPLTGLPNRALIELRVRDGLEQTRADGTKLGILFIDLDRFKHINDSLGHDVGDRLICAAASRLRQVIRNHDTVARIGGDEFLVLLPHLTSPQDATRIASELVRCLREPFVLAGHNLHISASIGVAVSPDDGTDYASMRRTADRAMYAAKAAGKGRYVRQSDPDLPEPPLPWPR